MQTFVTERLILTPMTTADVDHVYAVYSHPEILKLYPERPIDAFSDTIPFIRKITSNGNQVWCIRLKQNHATIGDCALHHWNQRENSIEIGGALLPEYWGKGVMREAFTVLMTYAMREMNILTFLGRTSSSNTQAIRLVEKMGFTGLQSDEKETLMIKNLEPDT